MNRIRYVDGHLRNRIPAILVYRTSNNFYYAVHMHHLTQEMPKISLLMHGSALCLDY